MTYFAKLGAGEGDGRLDLLHGGVLPHRFPATVVQKSSTGKRETVNDAC
jgi:hypothetical protein